jgi:hypothetical protein
MKWKFEEEFRLDKPETIGETDKHFDLDNYKDWLEFQLSESRKQLSLFAVSRELPTTCSCLHSRVSSYTGKCDFCGLIKKGNFY